MMPDVEAAVFFEYASMRTPCASVSIIVEIFPSLSHLQLPFDNACLPSYNVYTKPSPAPTLS